LPLLYKKSYPYTNEDFSYHSISEKDFYLLDELLKDSPDWILTKSHHDVKNNIRVNAFYTKNISLYIPNFEFTKYASSFKIDLILPFGLQESANKLLEFENLSNHILTEETDYFDHDYTKKKYKDAPSSMKMGIPDVSTQNGKRTTASMMVTFGFLPFFPVYKTLWLSSFNYDKNNQTVKGVVKIVNPVESEEKKDHYKVVKQEYIDKNGKKKKMKYTYGKVIQFYSFSRKNDNQTYVTYMNITAGFSKKSYNDFLIKVASKEVCKEFIKGLSHEIKYKRKGNEILRQIDEILHEKEDEIEVDLTKNNENIDETINIEEKEEVKEEEKVKEEEIKEEIKE